MSYTTMPIVGGWHRPPALVLMSALAIDTPLTLWAEPDNAFDPNAIAVFLNSEDIPSSAYDNLEVMLPPVGFTLEQVKDQTYWHLGYIPKERAAELKFASVVINDTPLPVFFAINAQGKPRVRFAEAVL